MWEIFKINFSNQIELLCSSLSKVAAKEGREYDQWRWCLYPRSRGSEFKLWSEILWSFLLIVNVTSRPPAPLLRDQSWFPAPSVTIWTERDNWGIKELVMLLKMRARKLASLKFKDGDERVWEWKYRMAEIPFDKQCSHADYYNYCCSYTIYANQGHRWMHHLKSTVASLP